MRIIRLVFNEKENVCEMYNGDIKIESYTYTEGEIVLSALEALKVLDVIYLEIQYK
ncbi:hypothetical protein M5X17_31065 [Paenibacillus alvei]|uniref:hypothetical protein n=1 Tax=Paenibacillus alvei TaxID=44250 RepID=UPI00227E726C|nr:hypothetical protein [Paenibacillus alvei]MCY9738134.1 hypothetical protein [Paenibacillus alvei]